MSLLLKKTIVHYFLDTLQVPYTKLYLSKLITKQPDHNSLFAVSNTLREYNVDNISIKVDPKEITKIPCPFITQINSKQFAIILSTGESEIEYVNENGISLKQNIGEFLENWSGVALMANKTQNSIEKNYALNRRKQLFEQIKLPFLALVSLLTVVFYFINNHVPQNFVNIAIVALVLAGISISILLIIQGINKNNSFIAKICNLNKKTSCSNVLESPAAKFIGIISWSHIGLIYFTGTLLNLVFVTHSSPLLFILNICSLPYSFWSIYYQWKIAKKWCVLCIAVQCIFVLTFILFLNSVSAQDFKEINIQTVVSVLICFAWAFLATTLIAPFIEEANKVDPMEHEIKKLKSDELIFKTYLQSAPHFNIDNDNKYIQFGNPESSFVITMVTSPTCGPCAAIHNQLEELLDQYEDDIRVQLIYAVNSNNEKQNSAVKWLLGIYLNYDPLKVTEIYNEWYSSGKLDFNSFCLKYPISQEDPRIQEIYNSHQAWCKASNVTVTPTLYVNGHKLPDLYQVDDLKYFI